MKLLVLTLAVLPSYSPDYCLFFGKCKLYLHFVFLPLLAAQTLTDNIAKIKDIVNCATVAVKTRNTDIKDQTKHSFLRSEFTWPAPIECSCYVTFIAI